MTIAPSASAPSPLGPARYGRFEAIPMTGSFGAEIPGVRLADALGDDELFADIRTAWLRYQVLFFREQTMAPEELLALGRRFGEIQEQGYAPGLPGTPGVWVQEYPDMYRMPVSDIDWHADGSFRPNPTRGSLLMALDVPAGAGDTVWADMAAAFDALSPAWQRFLEGLTAIHDNAARNLLRLFEQMGPQAVADMRRYLRPTEHPVVCTHPESGRRFLFVSELMTREIAGMSERESRAVLDFLYAHQTRPEFQCRFRWRPGSVALWDNYSTIHRGIFDFGQAHRLMHRVSFHDGWRPAG